MTYISELDDTAEGARHLTRVLESLHDEVLAYSMHHSKGHSRELSLVAMKLEEARLWSIRHGEKNGTHTVIDSRELLGGEPDAS